MKDAFQIIETLQLGRIDEQLLAELITRIEADYHLKVSGDFIEAKKLWQVGLRAPNGLTYYGEGRSLPTALVDALEDWFLEIGNRRN